MSTQKKYTSFWSFYPYYLTEHSSSSNRLLHFIGTGLILGFLIAAISFQSWKLIAAIPFCGYGFAWVGHFFIEKNRPATFTYPLYSLGSDFVMFWHILTGQIKTKISEAREQIDRQA